VAEMNVMSDQTAALKSKYKGVEDRRTRLQILEDANKQLRVKMDSINKTKEDQDGIVEELRSVNNKLKKRLHEAQYVSSADLDGAKEEAQATEWQNMELREELLEVTMVLERVGDSPAVPSLMGPPHLSQQLHGLGPAEQNDLGFWSHPMMPPTMQAEYYRGGASQAAGSSLPVVPEAAPHMSFTVPEAAPHMSFTGDPFRSNASPRAVMTSPRGFNASPRAGSSSPRGAVSPRGGSLSPPIPPTTAPVRGPGTTNGTDARLLAAVQNVTRALSPGATPTVAASRGAAPRSVSPYASRQKGGSGLAPRLRR